MQIDINDLTIGELEEVEDLSGAKASELFSGGLSAKALASLVCVVKRREDPDFTIDDARKVRFADLEVVREADPTE